MQTNSKEYQTYKDLEHWQPANEILLVEEFTNKTEKLSTLLIYLYNKTKNEYKNFPIRKDGTNPFIHPLNLAWDLKKAKVEDAITLIVALIHDLVEEKVDVYQEKNKIVEDEAGVKLLDEYELQLFNELESEIVEFCNSKRIEVEVVKEMIELLKLLTRHKRHFYYRSISAIFTCKDELLKEKAIQVKLADRIHNNQSLDSFCFQGKIYQCFKNLFIINNTKKYLIDKYGENDDHNEGIHPTEKLFKKCCKLTYDAFLNVCNLCLNSGAKEVESMLQLAFRKFVHEEHGLWNVTKVDKEEAHPMRLYRGIVRKYDARLHLEFDRYEKMKDYEMNFCKKFFSDFNFSEEKLKSILCYKDAYALKEVISRMLYKPNFVIAGFGCSELCSRGMVCMKED